VRFAAAVRRDGTRLWLTGRLWVYTIDKLARMLSQAMGFDHLAPDIMDKARAGDVRHSFADIPLARDRLGYDPKRKRRHGATLPFQSRLSPAVGPTSTPGRASLEADRYRSGEWAFASSRAGCEGPLAGPVVQFGVVGFHRDRSQPTSATPKCSIILIGYDVPVLAFRLRNVLD
jgi:hypothetical protein